jgi:putative NIF3 family GTP cyclohydrolase 1 type 2
MMPGIHRYLIGELLDIGHFASEHIMVQMLVQKLRMAIKEKKLDVVVDACDLEKDPFMII